MQTIQRKRSLEAKLPKQRTDVPRKLKPVGAEEPQSANIKVALVQSRPGTCCYLNGNTDGHKMYSGPEISLIHSKHPAVNGKEIGAAGVKLVTAHDKPLQTEGATGLQVMLGSL